MFPLLPTRTFQIRGPFGLQLTLGTTVPGTLSFTFPRTRTRSHSRTNAPLAKAASAPATTTTPLDNPLHAFDQIQIDIPMIVPSEPPPIALRCPPSPAPTEVIMTQEEMVLDIQHTKGIKVRDFAYEATPPGLKRVPELFDPDKALGEHDYRLSKQPRTFPIPGKILRRLLDIGWVKLQEARERWHKMDWDELAAHDSRPTYPWNTLKLPFPTDEQREIICKGRAVYLDALERAQRIEQAHQQQEQAFHLEQQEQQQQQQEQEVPFQDDVEMSSSELELPTSPSYPAPRGAKRQLSCGHDGLPTQGDNTPSHQTSPTPDSKRRKLENDTSSSPSSSSPSSSYTPPSIPPKQFPAPLAAYNTAIHSMIPNTTTTTTTTTRASTAATTNNSSWRNSSTAVASSSSSSSSSSGPPAQQTVSASPTTPASTSVADSPPRSKGLRRNGTIHNIS